MSEWQDIATAPKDGTTILVHDGFGPMWARFHLAPTFEDFQQIAEIDEGLEDYKCWLDDLRSDPAEFVDEWEFGTFSNDEVIEEANPTHWKPIDAPTPPEADQ